MKNIVCLFSLCTIALLSCKKVATDAVSVLQSHSWYPYQTHMVVTDTTIVTERNNTTGAQTVRKYNRKVDTTFINSACEQQTNMQFQQGGTYVVNAQCTNPSSILTGQWFTLPSNPNTIRTYYQLPTTPMPAGFPSFAFGDINSSSVTKDQFMVVAFFHSRIGMSTNNQQYDSLIVKDSSITVTCKSR